MTRRGKGKHDQAAHIILYSTEGTFGSVRETLMHLFAAEEGYVRSFTGTTPTPPLKELTKFVMYNEE